MTAAGWIPAFAGMTAAGWIPAFAGMTAAGWIPAPAPDIDPEFARMT